MENFLRLKLSDCVDEVTLARAFRALQMCCLYLFKNLFYLSPLLLSPSATLLSLPLHLLASAPLTSLRSLPGHHIAPLLCGLSFVTPAGYSFVPPSSAPFWSGTGIASLSVCSLTLFISLSVCFHVDGCLACWL